MQNPKDSLYQGKEWLKQLFVYPALKYKDVDYDLYWENKRGDLIGSLSSWQKKRADFILEKIDGDKNSFVDIGCGDGSVLKYIAEHSRTSSLVGVDISDVALSKAQLRGIKTIQADISEKNFLQKLPTSDYVLLLEVLEHIGHSEKLLEQAYKLSKKGVFFSFPNTGFIVHRLRLFLGRFPLQWTLFPGEHLRFWTKKDLVWWLDSLGYREYTIHCYNGVSGLNILWPGMFALGFMVYLPKKSKQ